VTTGVRSVPQVRFTKLCAIWYRSRSVALRGPFVHAEESAAKGKRKQQRCDVDQDQLRSRAAYLISSLDSSL
jgi:hypothetical protein